MRSAAEKEIRDAVVSRLRQWRPEARICHEVNVSPFGSNRMDLIAVSLAEIIAVEIKSEKDNLSRAQAQIKAMNRVAHFSVAAVHSKHLKRTPAANAHLRHEVNPAGGYWCHGTPAELKYVAAVWVFPEPQINGPSWIWRRWSSPEVRPQTPLPSTALNLLWRDELAWLADYLGIAAPRRATIGALSAVLRWNATGADLTRGICSALRARPFAEADEPIQIAAADRPMTAAVVR